MAKSTRLVKSFSRLLFPIILLVAAAVIGGAVWLIYTTARPLNSRYIVTPDKYGQLSTRAAQVTEETWVNRDGSTSRGWLLRGAENAPAVILLHKFGADRSYVLNLGVKLNESTDFTVLMPDQRAHGENPPVQNASFGGCEAEDAASAVEFLKGLKTPNQIALVNKNKLGIFGIELGALVAVTTAAKAHRWTYIKRASRAGAASGRRSLSHGAVGFCSLRGRCEGNRYQFWLSGSYSKSP